MLTDAFLQLSTAQAVTATAVSTNTVDLGVARDIAPGRPLYAVFQIDTTFTAAGGATMNCQVISSAAANLGSPTVIGDSGPIPVAQLTAGRKLIAVGIGPSVLNAAPNGQRFIGAQYTIGTGPMTAGAITATIVDTLPPGAQLYGSGFSVA
jgi:hypothetical protein